MVEDKKMTKSSVQNIMIENREKMSISGVVDVESFNDETVIVDTELGQLIITGEELRINKLNLESSELIVEGCIVSCEYNDKDNSRSKGGFFAKMFR